MNCHSIALCQQSTVPEKSTQGILPQPQNQTPCRITAVISINTILLRTEIQSTTPPLPRSIYCAIVLLLIDKNLDSTRLNMPQNKNFRTVRVRVVVFRAYKYKAIG